MVIRKGPGFIEGFIKGFRAAGHIDVCTAADTVKSGEMMNIKKFPPVAGFIILFIAVFASLSDAGMSYICVDDKGGESISDYPLDGLTYTEMGEIREITAEEKQEYERERNEKARKERRNSTKKSPLKACFENANDFYGEELKKYCKANGLKDKCESMAFQSARPVQEAYIRQINICIQTHKTAK